jgi:hypothetical protein
MAFTLKTWSSFEGNLPNAEKILVRQGTEALKEIGDTLRESARTKIRYDTGEASRRIKIEISGRGLNKLVEVYGELVQHYVDEEGLPPGIFPPWDVGSRIYKYVERKGLHQRGGQTHWVINPTTGLRERAKVAVNRGRPRLASHVNSRRPASVRATLRAKGTEVGGARGSNETSSGANVGGRKRGTKRPAKQPSTRSNRSLSRERAIRRVAFMIARSIFERGIKANRWASRTLEDNRVGIIRDLQNAFMKAIAEINGR